MELMRELTQGVGELGLSLSDSQLNQLVELQSQLMKWTKAFNLTAITDEKEVLKLHLLDSLSIASFWREAQEKGAGFVNKTLDVGTGAGFPGLPLAIVYPEKEFHLLDSNSKKIRFIRQQIHHLGLKNVSAFHGRVQQHQINDYSRIVSRAFASISDMVEMTEPLLAKNGRWMAMKGVYSAQEKADLPHYVVESNFYPLKVPGLDAERCLVELVRRND